MFNEREMSKAIDWLFELFSPEDYEGYDEDEIGYAGGLCLPEVCTALRGAAQTVYQYSVAGGYEKCFNYRGMELFDQRACLIISDVEQAVLDEIKTTYETELWLMDTGADASESALTPDGNLTLVDDVGSPDKTGKQFITAVTKNGNYFYIIIDRDDEGNETVHFLNQVDEADLLMLMSEEEAAKYTEPVVETTPEPTETEPEPKVTEPAPEEKPKTNMLPVVLLVVALIGGGGFFVFKKMQGKKKEKEAAKPDPDADYVDDDEDYGYVEEDDDDADFIVDDEDNEPV